MSAVKERPTSNGYGTVIASAIAVVLCAGAAAMYFWTDPAATEPVTLQTAVPIPTGPGIELHERQASVASLNASAPQVDLPRSAASAAAMSAPSIGASAAMQDYGQIVLTALHGGTSKQAGEAAKLIAECQFATRGREFVEHLKSRGGFDGETIGSMTSRAEQRIRRCQSITPDMTARVAELAERGILGGMKGLSDIYGRAVDYAPPMAMRQPLIDALKADFLDGHWLTGYMLGSRGRPLGLSQIEAHAYALAARMVEERWHRSIGVEPPPLWRELDNTLSAEELQQAEALATEWTKRVKVSPDSTG